MEAPESLETAQARHRKEQRDLVSQVTQKKKNATKKTRKGVNDECERLERDLKERQAEELAILRGESTANVEAVEDEVEEGAPHTDGLEEAVAELTVSTPKPTASSGPTPPQESGAKKKPNRAKTRLARRAAKQEALVEEAAEEAANMPDLAELERKRMEEHFGKHKLQVKDIRADGHCLYAAVADQMENRGLDLKPRIQTKVHHEGAPYKNVRYAAADFIQANPGDFVAFLEEPLDTYLQKIRETGEWGGHVELLALAKTYGIKINVLHGDGRVDKIEPENAIGSGKTEDIWLGYYKHSHGLGEHYNSLRKAP